VHHRELTRVDIFALAASLYEPMPRLWLNQQWRCPQCKRWNLSPWEFCDCGISRDGRPEFCEAYSEEVISDLADVDRRRMTVGTTLRTTGLVVQHAGRNSAICIYLANRPFVNFAARQLNLIRCHAQWAVRRFLRTTERSALPIASRNFTPGL
jgi:hypothetical protein